VELIKIAVRIAAVALERKQVQEALHASHERLHVLSQRLVETQENERRRIARELHDEVGQGLTAVKINLQGSRRISGANVLLNRQLDESIGIVEQTIQQVRNISLDLRPSLLDDLGLIAALRWYIDRVAQRSNLKALFTIHLIPALRLSPDLETTCFRIVQEALTNVVRHAQAQHVTVSLELLDKELLLEVQDDGKGFDTVAARQRSAQGHSLGLLGLEERAMLAGGRFTLESSETRGTIMQVRFPLPELELSAEVLEEVSAELLERNAV
jgi:signal transduction histidine kinase